MIKKNPNTINEEIKKYSKVSNPEVVKKTSKPPVDPLITMEIRHAKVNKQREQRLNQLEKDNERGKENSSINDKIPKTSSPNNSSSVKPSSAAPFNLKVKDKDKEIDKKIRFSSKNPVHFTEKSPINIDEHLKNLSEQKRKMKEEVQLIADEVKKIHESVKKEAAELKELDLAKKMMEQSKENKRKLEEEHKKLIVEKEKAKIESLKFRAKKFVEKIQRIIDYSIRKCKSEAIMELRKYFLDLNVKSRKVVCMIKLKKKMSTLKFARSYTIKEITDRETQHFLEMEKKYKQMEESALNFLKRKSFYKVTSALKKNSIQEKNLKDIQKENEILKQQTMSFLRNFKAKIAEQAKKNDAPQKPKELMNFQEEVSIPHIIDRVPEKIQSLNPPQDALVEQKNKDFEDKLKVFTDIVTKIDKKSPINKINGHSFSTENDSKLKNLSPNKTNMNNININQEKFITVREENIIKEIIKENIINLPIINEETDSQANTEDLNLNINTRKMEIFKEDVKEQANENEFGNGKENQKEQQNNNANPIQQMVNQINKKCAPVLTNMDKRYEERKQKREELRKMYEEKKKLKEMEEQEIKRKKDEEEKLKRQELAKQKKLEKQKKEQQVIKKKQMEDKLAKQFEDADLHKNKNLAKKSILGLHIIINSIKDKEFKATQFHLKYSQKYHFNQLMKFFLVEKAERMEREKAQNEVSDEFYNFHIKQKSINGFFKFYVMSNEESENYKKKHHSHLLLQFIREWKRTMPSIRIENEELNKNVNRKIKQFKKVP